ncbi:MAG: ATPase [gamma proteobacterium symbiont of Taylorina sp.]|nr:ATPase [gamma proteobacterium symbiont of Taylorina sp.]
MKLFHCENMQHISLLMRFDDAPLVSNLLAESGVFDPCGIASEKKHLPDQQGAAYRRIFDSALSDWDKITDYLALTPAATVNKVIAINKHQLLEIELRLSEIWALCAEHKENKRLLDIQLSSLQHLFSLLNQFKNIDIDLSVMKQTFSLLDVRLGIIPLTYVSRLKEALGIEGYYLSVYHQYGDNAHIVIAGVRKINEDILSLLDSASFQCLHIPEEFHEHPKTVYISLNEKKQQLLQQVDDLEQSWLILKEHYTAEIFRQGELLTLAKPYAILSEKMLRNGQLIQINGWIPDSKISLIQEKLEHDIANPIVVETRKPTPDEYAKTPSYLLRPQWIQPFLKLVTHYGTPGYREFDPSWFFSLSYILMFGIMFGDIGHGACIIGLSLLFKKGLKKQQRPEYFSFFLSIGASSVFFGFLYGSIFSYEHIIPGLWLSPMEHPMLMLKLALIWGASFIILLNIISIYNRLMSLQFKEALFNAKGVSGLLLYIAILWSIIDISQDQFSSLNVWSIMTPLVIIFIYQWIKGSGSAAERFLVSLFEAYDVIIANFSNTLSFLRVAAFALNHSALAIALLTLAAIAEGAGHWAVIIFGNMFILVLEGAIVAIQVLRLEYYEGFSRFFTADGYLFKPMELSPQKLKN